MLHKLSRKRRNQKVAIMFMAGLSFCFTSATFSQVPMTPRGDVQRVTDTGMLIEPSLRMKGKSMSWDNEIRIALPQGYDPNDGKRYPVLWVTDGNVFFEGATAEVAYAGTWGVPEMIVVAIGVPPDVDVEFVRRRTYELIPAQPTSTGATVAVGPAADLYKRRAERKTLLAGPPLPPADRFGGADVFLSFLVDEVRPMLAKRYKLSGDDTLYGFSAGGIFCETALFTRPEAFSRYICSSGAPNNAPGGGIFRLEEQYAATHKDLKAHLFLSIGEREALDDGFAFAQLFTGGAQLAQILKIRNYPSLDLHFKIMPEQVHSFINAFQSLQAGLRAVYPTIEQPHDVSQYRPIMAHGRLHKALRKK